MPDPHLLDRWDGTDSPEPFVRAVREWEPAIEFFTATDNALLFESEATLYAVCLSASRLRHRHRVVEVKPGDVLVVPGGVGVEADPGLNLVGFAHAGVPPFHFRERFIQSVCFEHLPFPTDGEGPARPIIHRTDARHRLPIEALIPGDARHEPSADPLSLRIWVVLEGEVVAEIDGRPVEARAGDLLAIPAGVSASLAGPGSVVAIDLMPELLHDARREQAAIAKGPDWSPEHAPSPSS